MTMATKKKGQYSCGMPAGDTVYMNCNRGHLWMALAGLLSSDASTT
jgi:hypothetical protein